MALVHNFDLQLHRRHTDAQMYTVYPDDVLPMHLAETDFSTAQPITEALMIRAAFPAYGYTAERSSFPLAVSHWMSSRFNWTIEPEWVEYSPSVGSTVVFAIQSFTQPGDRIVIQTPVYHAFHTLIENSGRVKAENKLVLHEGRYAIDFDDLERQLAHPRTKLMVLCHPHNPIGRVWTPEELQRISELCLRHHVFVVSDEVHSDLVFAGHRHIPLPLISQAIAEQCIVAINPSKTFNLAGMRASAAIIPNRRWRDALRMTLISNKALDRPVFGMVALEAAYMQGGYYVDQLVPYIEANAQLVDAYLAKHIPGLSVIRPEATYMLWLDARKLGLKPEQLAPFFLTHARIGLRDGAVCGNGSGFLRMSIGFPRAVLKQALERLRSAAAGLKPRA